MFQVSDAGALEKDILITMQEEVFALIHTQDQFIYQCFFVMGQENGAPSGYIVRGIEPGSLGLWGTNVNYCIIMSPISFQESPH